MVTFCNLSLYRVYEVTFLICLTLTLSGIFFARMKLHTRAWFTVRMPSWTSRLTNNETNAYFCENQSSSECASMTSYEMYAPAYDHVCFSPIFYNQSDWSLTNITDKDSFSNTDEPFLVTGLLPHLVRLGNHMFTYAAILGIAHDLGRRPFILPSPQLQKTFLLSQVKNRPDIFQWPMVRYIPWATYNTDFYKLIPNQHICLCGYFQAWRFFSPISSHIRSEFSFTSSILREVDDIRREITGTDTTEIADVVVGIHVRQGDLHRDFFRNIGYRIAPLSYFIKACDWMRKQFPLKSIRFVVVTDKPDRLWCKNNLNAVDMIVARSASAAVHLALLASCNHVIISGGSFGWWGAWLAGGKVVYYEKYVKENSRISHYFRPTDYYLPDWIGIGD